MKLIEYHGTQVYKAKKRPFVSLFLMGFILIVAQNLFSTSIFSAQNLSHKEKDYLFALVEFLKDLPSHMAELPPNSKPSQAEVPPSSYTAWHQHLDNLKVPPRFLDFHKTLKAAIDRHALERRTPASVKIGISSPDLYEAAYGKFKKAYSHPDQNVLREIHDALYLVGGSSCTGGPCW